MRSYFVCLYVVTLVSFAFGKVKSTSASDALNKFSFKLLSETIKEQNQPNIVIGPYTVWVALSILNEGAQEKTERELVDTLHIPKHDLERQQFRDLQKNIVRSIVHSSEGITLDAINDIFARKEATIFSNYQDLIDNIYGVKVVSLDFGKNPKQAAQYINSKISNITRGRISTVVDTESVKSAEMYITSVLYFKGQWVERFETLNEKKPFYNERGEIISQVPMMWFTSDFGYGEILNGKAKIVQLPYKGNRLSMFIVLPEGDTLSAILNSIITIPVAEILNNVTIQKDVRVTMPKFKIITDLTLNSALQKLGIREVFTNKANLKSLSPDPLHVSTVSHKAGIEVNEEGTVAEAATIIKIVPLSFRVTPVVDVDKPFLYFVYDKVTQSILFMGKVSNPKIN